MTVAELIEQLNQMPQDVHVYAEGEPADKVIFEKSPDGNDGIVRIFKAWDVEFVGRGIRPKKCEYRNEIGNCLPIGGFCTAVGNKYCKKKNEEVAEIERQEKRNK